MCFRMGGRPEGSVARFLLHQEGKTMRANTKTITFEFEFEAPNGRGQYEPSSTITVCEPSFQNRDVFRRMGGYVAEASKGLMKMAGDKSKDEVEAEIAVEKGETADPDALVLMRLGLSIDGYETFMRYVERTLTGNKSLAYIGTNPDNRIALTEEAWMNLAAAGGLDQMERVIGEFTGFFFATPQAQAGSQTTSGTEKPSGSPVRVTAGSRTTKH